MYIEENQIKNREALGAIIKNVTCSLCLGVVIAPFSCDVCESLFCEKCLLSWKEENTGCPSQCSNAIFKQASKFVEDILHSLSIKCSGSCTKEFSYQSYLRHSCSAKVHCYNCGRVCEEGELLTQHSKFTETLKQNQKLKKQVSTLTKENKALRALLKQQSCVPKEPSLVKEEACEHFDSNFLFKYSCCGDLYGCITCHNTLTDHKADKFTSVKCKNCDSFNNQTQKSCLQCGTKFFFKRLVKRKNNTSKGNESTVVRR